MVVGLDGEAGRRHLVADVLVAAGVLAEAVDQQDRGPRRARRPFGGPLPDEDVRAIGGGDVAEDGWHSVSVRDYDAGMTEWTEVGDRVFVRRYEFYDQNIGVVLDGDEVLLIDTRSTHVQAREIAGHLGHL